MKIRHLRLLTLVLSAFFCSTIYAGEGVSIAYSESLQNVEMAGETAFGVQTPGTQKLSANGVRSLRFDAFSKRFDVRLQPNRTLLSAVQSSGLGKGVGVYRGDIAGAPGSWVRLVVVDDVPSGLLWDGQEMYAIEPDAGTGGAMIYRLDDLLIPPGTLTCSDLGAPKNGTGLLKAVTGEVSTALAAAPGATSQIDLAVIADFEFTDPRGAGTEAALLARMNNVDGIFSAQLGVQLNVNRIDIYADASDPFTDESDASLLIDELARFRSATPTQNANGLTHLFTGRNLDGSTVGIAFGGALCNRRFGAGLTQGTNGLTTDSLVAAHEFGHNFGAPHDGDNGAACGAEPETFLMAPRVSGSDQFSACSIAEMQADVARASCITPLPSTDVAVVAGAPMTALLGDSATLAFTVNGVGTDDASNVNLEVTIPAEVTLSVVSASTGSCSSGAGSASCALGTISAGSGVDVTIVVEATSVAAAEFAASVTAAIDANSSNNSATAQLTIDPAVDLIVTAAAAAQVTVNQGATIRTVVENRSTLVAGNVEFTVTPEAGLQIDGASWAPGSCNIDAGVATCQAATLAAQSSNTVSLQLTGTGEGATSYALAVSGDEVDRDTANNTAVGEVTVNAPAPAPSGSDDDSGGGALGWLTLLLLSFASLGSRMLRNSRKM